MSEKCHPCDPYMDKAGTETGWMVGWMVGSSIPDYLSKNPATENTGHYEVAHSNSLGGDITLCFVLQFV